MHRTINRTTDGQIQVERTTPPRLYHLSLVVSDIISLFTTFMAYYSDVTSSSGDVMFFSKSVIEMIGVY